MNAVIRIGGGAALIGGLLRFCAAFVPYAPNSPWLEAFYAVIDANLLVGLIGIFMAWCDRARGWGLAGFVIALIGQGSIIGPDATQFGIDFYVAESLILLAGLTLMSIDMMRAEVMRPVAALWLVAVGMAGASPIAGETAILAAGAAFGAAFVYAGAIMLARPSAGIQDPATSIAD